MSPAKIISIVGVSNMYSVYDLVEVFRDTFCPGERFTKEEKKMLVATLKEMLDKGHTAESIIRAFQVYKKNNDYIEFDAELIVKGKPKVYNLLRSKTFYYHNALRLTSAPPRREIDYNTGEIKNVNEAYFLEMKASFTIDDLVDYYIKQVRPTNMNNARARFTGSFNYLLKSYSVEEILFMIDVHANHIMSGDRNKPSTPLDITHFYDIAIEMRDNKRTETVLSGGKKIVRKKRRIKRS